MNNKTYTTTYKNLYSTCQRPVSAHHKLKLTTWNCRGLTSGEPYIHELDNKGSDIIVITEHWLWPYFTYCVENWFKDQELSLTLQHSRKLFGINGLVVTTNNLVLFMKTRLGLVVSSG